MKPSGASRAGWKRPGRAVRVKTAQPALPDLLAAAEDLLAATGNAVALCPTYGRPR